MKLFLFNNDEKLIGTVSPLEGIQNEEINKIQTIECTVVYSELIEKASYIGHKDYSDNRIFHLYKIDHVTKTSTTDVKIVGVHTFFDDMESDGYVKDFRPTNRELVGVLTTILDGSRWQLGTVNIQRRYTGNFYYVTRKEAISKLIEATQIEIKPRLEFSRGKITGRYLDVFTRLGARNGKVFVHGRDLLTVSEKKSQGAIYTAVVGRGKGEETDTGGYGRRISFKDVEWRRTSGQPVDKPVGQEYVEIPAMTRLYGFEKGTKPRIKIVEFQDETDKEKLLRLSYEWLEKNSRMQVEYSAKVLNVGNLELGDTVGIFNPKLGIKYETRVFKVKRNLVNNKLTEFGIGDKVTTSPFSRTIELAKEMKNFQDDTVYWLDKIRERLSDKLINEDGYNYDLKADNEYKVPAGYYSFDKPIDQNPTKVVYMGAGKIAIADSKKPTGEWNWKTFLDGRGATLDLINTGVLKAGRIQSADGRSYWDLDTGEIHMEQSAINEAVKTAVNGKVQEIVGEVKKNLPTKEELKGKSSYLHKKYSDYPDGRNMSDNSTLKYIGIYTGDKQQAPTNASEYSWTKIRGEDGERGRDGTDGKSINENFLPNSNFSQDFRNWENWEDRLTNSGLNYDKGHAIYHFGRGLHIFGTANADYKGFSSVPFNLIAKQGDKLTLSMDLGKDALTLNAPLKLALHYIDDKDIIVGQEWQTLDLATQNFEVRKYKRISRVFTVGKDIRKCRVMIFAAARQPINFYIDNIKLERGDTATEWCPAYEDLRGRDGRNGDSYTRNYLSGTADEKVLLAINDNYDVQEAFKLVDNKNFRDLGFKNGDKITFIADYEILPNGSNKKINKLNFEWHDDVQYRVWMDQDINPTKGTYVRTLTMNNDLLDCKRARFRADNVNAKIKITNARVIQGDMVQPWSIAQEDLQGHSLTANLRFEGRYINSVTTDVKVYLDVYYDGQKVDSGFNAQVKYKGGNRTDWSGFWNANVGTDGGLTNIGWGNREQNGTPLEVIVLVTYKGLNTIANARMENVPDIVEIKEITKKYKTFESTIDRFDSTIGEVKQQVLANEENRNLIIGSRILNETDYKVFGKVWDGVSKQGIYTQIRQSTGDGVNTIHNGNSYLFVVAQNNTQPVWQGVGFNISSKILLPGRKYSLRIPYYILPGHVVDKGIFVEIKNHNTGRVVWNEEIPTNYKESWIEKEVTFRTDRTEYLSDYSFYIYAVQNGGFCISTPYMCEGDVLPKTYSPAPEDVHLQNSRIESSIKQTKDEIDLKVSKDNVIASINASVETTGEGPAQGVVKINADKVDISGVLRAYTGEIGGFRIGYNYNDGGFWLTGKNNFDCGINPGLNEGSNGAQLWAAWGRTWTQAGPNAWWVTAQGIMVCKNTPTFHKGMEVYGRYIDTHGNDIQGNQSGGGKTTVIWWSQINSVKSQISDERLKNNIKPTKVNALDLLNNIEMVEFNWKKDGKFEKIGAIAQQVQSVDKDLVVHDMDDKQTYNDYLRINYYDTIPYLIKAVQELSEENTNLKSQLKAMNERLTKLEDKINGKL